MNEEIVARWNSTVRPGDIVFHLGDVALCSGEDEKKRALDDVMQRINGRLCLVAGNHDNEWVYQYFDRVWGVKERKNCVLSHVPVHPSQKQRFRLNIHGHLHDHVVLETVSKPYDIPGKGVGWKQQPDPWYYCASIEQHDLAPVPWEDIVNERLRK